MRMSFAGVWVLSTVLLMAGGLRGAETPPPTEPKPAEAKPVSAAESKSAEASKPEVKPAAEAAPPKADAKPAVKPKAEAEAKPKPKPDAKKDGDTAEPKAAAKPEAASATKPKSAPKKAADAAKPKAEAKPKAADKSKPATDAKPKADAAPKPAAKPAIPPATTGARFPSSVVTLGGTRVLAFEVTEPAPHDRTFTAASSDPSTLEVVRVPAALAGQRLGFLRVRGVKPGAATLRVGDAVLQLTVADDPVHPAAERLPRPRIVAPARGAVVWGKLSVGVELTDDPLHPAEVSVLLPDGKTLPLVEEVGFDQGPTRRFSFAFDADAVPPGPLTLVAVAQGAGQTEMASEPVTVDVVRPDAAALLAGEAEDLRDMPRPPRYVVKDAEVQPELKIGKAADASGGEFVLNNGPRPPLVGTLTVDKSAWYQLALTVSGDFGGGAFPTVGFRLDNDNDPTTSGRLTQEGWHRIAIGVPVYLEPGEQWLTAYFENDFGAKGQDRNLRIDRFDLLRLETLPVSRHVIPSPGDDRLAVSMNATIDDRKLAAGVTLEGRATWDKRISADPPHVSLLINGEPVLSQQTASPRFVVDRGRLKAGVNTLAMEAKLANGLTARTPEQRVTPAAFEGGDPVARQMRLFPVYDPAWDDATRSVLRLDGGWKDRVAAWPSRKTGTLTLPDELTGVFQVRLLARADTYKGDVIARVVVKHGEAELLAEDVNVSRGYHRQFTVGSADLPAGPKTITVEFTNDLYEGSAKKDRNLYLGGILLQEEWSKDVTKPTAKLIYPAADTEIGPTDSLIVDVADDRQIAWAELLVDGQRTGVRTSPAVGESRLVVPVVLRGDSRERTLEALVSDAAGNTVKTDAVPVRVVDGATRYERAVRLLDRFAFGPEPRELADVLTMGEEAYLRDRLYRRWDDHGEQAAWSRALVENANNRNSGSVERRALLWAMTTPNPVRARFTFWTANHFSTWQRKAEPHRKSEEFARFAAMGPARFLDLLETSATSPAMLYYLDQHRSYGRRINENYAREIMELHSVGVKGGYTQADVTALANLLTGWTLTDEAPVAGSPRLESTYRYVPDLNDPAGREVFGLHLEETNDPMLRRDRVQLVIEMLAAHPSTAEYICHKLVEHYVATPAPQPLVEDLARVFMQTGGDLREVLLALAKHEAFWQAERRIARPLDHAMRLSRAVRNDNPSVITAYLNRSAVGLFDKDTPDGYPEEDEAYTDSNVTLQRWRLAAEQDYRLLSLIPDALRSPPKESEKVPAWRQAVVDTAAVRLLGRTLSDDSNTAVLTMMEASEDVSAADLMRSTAALVAQMPEANLR